MFPADAIGTNASERGVDLTAQGANTVLNAGATGSWGQGNAFTKIFSAAARVTGGRSALLDPASVYKTWLGVLQGSQQPNFVPFNPFSGFECVGAIEFVNYMLLQSDPAGFLGLFDAWPRDMDASFERLRGRGAFVVSSSLRGGVVGNTTVVSQRGGRCVVRRPRSWSRDAA